MKRLPVIPLLLLLASTVIPSGAKESPLSFRAEPPSLSFRAEPPSLSFRAEPPSLSFRAERRNLPLSFRAERSGVEKSPAAPAALAAIDTARIDAALTRYIDAIERSPLEAKQRECDFLIGACADSLVRQYVGIRLYDHYVTSPLMGDEAVAIYLYDNWFAPKRIAFESPLDLLNAGIYADFNRHSLIGLPAPAVTLEDGAGERVTLPLKGDFSVLYFYDTDCARSRLESALLRMLLSSGQFPLTFCAVYVGDKRDAWQQYADEQLAVTSDAVRVLHLWDPELASDFQRLYGVMQTPRLFLLAPDGRILGRQLNAEALLELLKIYYGK